MSATTNNELKLTDFTERELEIAEALGVKDKLPNGNNLFNGGCLCHTFPKESDLSCSSHSKMLGDIKNVVALIHHKEVEARLSELSLITKDTFDKPETPENQNDRTWQGGYRFAKNSLKRYKLNRVATLQAQKELK